MPYNLPASSNHLPKFNSDNNSLIERFRRMLILVLVKVCEYHNGINGNVIYLYV